jgi:hypothetical protein
LPILPLRSLLAHARTAHASGNQGGDTNVGICCVIKRLQLQAADECISQVEWQQRSAATVSVKHGLHLVAFSMSHITHLVIILTHI